VKVGDLVKAPYLVDLNRDDMGIVLEILPNRLVQVMWSKNIKPALVHLELLEVINEGR